MKRITLNIVLVTLLFLLIPGILFASGGHDKRKPDKTGILLVAFGSSEKSAWVSFDNIEKEVKSAYPGIPVRWSYTSHIIRKKLAGQGKLLDSPETALAKMLDEKFTHVVVQSLHTIAGEEYHGLVRTVASFRMMNGFENISLGEPLLSTQEDMAKAVGAAISIIPDKRKKDEAVVFMGHGTHHPANAFYAALMFQLQLKDKNIFLGTVEGYPDIELIKKMLIESKIKKVYLLPFMSVAGDHAKNDMAGDEDNSWKSILASAGIEPVCILKGTAENKLFTDIWVSHIGRAMKAFKKDI